MNGLFITGTDTGIGKTVCTALLLAELRRRGMNAAPMKPAQTGCVKRDTPGAPDTTPDSFSVPDLDYALSMAGMQVDPDVYRTMSPYRFEPACSPHLAAKMAAAEIDIARIVIAARTLGSTYDFILAEGAGGILVPLNERETMLDLMQALRFPILLAARPGLGTINHTLLSLRALRSDGLDIAGIVFVTAADQEPGLIEEDNRRIVEHFGKVPLLGVIPYCAPLAGAAPGYGQIPVSVVAETEKLVDRLAL
jgi:dethiobiotin synthetase